MATHAEYVSINTEDAHTLLARRLAPSPRWPLAGMKLDDLRQTFGLASDAKPARIWIKNTPQDYLVSNGYLIPHYTMAVAPDTADQPQQALQERNEALLISRARGFVNNAQPELGVPQTKAQIDQALAYFKEMPEGTHEQCAQKAGQFKIIVGSILSRMETLGRAITQRTSHGTALEYDTWKGKTYFTEKMLDALKNQHHLTDEAISQFKQTYAVSEEDIDQLRTEFLQYANFLQHSNILPLLHCVLLHDRQIDTDGVLIDLLREAAKTLVPITLASPEGEGFVRVGIVEKIGMAMESIDEVNSCLQKFLAEDPLKTLFIQSIEDFVRRRGSDYGLTAEGAAETILRKIDYFATLCRARACTRGSDQEAYDAIFRQKEALNQFFNDPNGLLQSMRATGRNTSKINIQKLRDVISQSLTVMDRTGYTRIPCNQNAPEPWIPNFNKDASPMEHYLVKEVLPGDAKKRATRVLNAAQNLPVGDQNTYLKQQFCSLGWIQSSIQELRQEVERAASANLPKGRG